MLPQNTRLLRISDGVVSPVRLSLLARLGYQAVFHWSCIVVNWYAAFSNLYTLDF